MPFFHSKGRAAPAGPPCPGQSQRRVSPAVILRENFWELLLLNFCFCACVLPFLALGLFFLSAGALTPALVCLALSAPFSGPACCAMARVFCDWQRGRAYAPVRCFWSAYRKSWGRGALLGLFYQPLLALAGFACRFYFGSPAGSLLFLLCGWLSLFFSLVLLASSFYGYMMAANLALSLPQVLKNAFFLFFLDRKDSLFLCGASLLCTLAVWIALPYTFFLVPVGYFSALWLLNSSFAWRGILQFVVPPAPPEKSAEK